MGSTAHVFVVLVGLLIVLPLSLTSVPIAFACASGLGIVTMALTIGLRRTGTGFLILGYGTVSMNDVRPIGPLIFLELSDILLMTGFLLLVPHLAGTALRLPKAFLLGGIGLLTVGAFSALASDQPGGNFAFLSDIAIGVVLVPVLLVWWQPGHRSTMAAAAAYMLGNTISVVASQFQEPYGDGRYAGLTTHPNVMGLCQVMSLALAPFLLATLPRRYKWIVGIGVVVSMYGIWISGSRAALLCGVALTLLYPVFRRSIPAALAVGALMAPAIVVLDRVSQNPDPSNVLGRLLGAGSAGASNESRKGGAQAGIDQFLGNPLLGDGWLTVWGAHNIYLQIAAAIGVFGLGFYLMMLVPILRPLIAVPPPYGLLAAPGLAMAMLSLVDPALGSRYIWVVAALALSADRLAALAEKPSGQVDDPRVQPSATGHP